MCGGGLQADKYNLLYKASADVNIAVRTPVGKIEEGNIKNVVQQGNTFGPLLCSKQVDMLGQECLEEQKYTYTFIRVSFKFHH